MQIIGIYLRAGDERVIKNLKLDVWYPFGQLKDCRNVFKKDGSKNPTAYQKYLDYLEENREFNSSFYELNSTDSAPSINLNCLVGKNGSGKSTLLALEYRIINNLACALKHYLPSYNQDYEPTWASGFEADLYYESRKEIFCIRIQNNKDFLEDERGFIDNSVSFYSSDGNYQQLFTDALNAYEDTIVRKDSIIIGKNEVNIGELNKNAQTLLDKLSNDLFYSVATNYSIYSNTTVSVINANKSEQWLTNLYHKNDGYFTPIVLVPYKKDGVSIDIGKELNLAKERVSTLSLLIYSETGSDFIEGFLPDSIEYKLLDITTFKKIINDKRDKLLKDGEENFVTWKELYKDSKETYSIHYIHNELKKKWNNQLFTETKNNAILSQLKNCLKPNDDDISINELYTIIKDNTLEYLAYKLIKMCRYYDDYKKRLGNKDILDAYFDKEKDYKVELDNIIHELCSKNVKTDFTNLKILQCISFLKNIQYYLDSTTISKKDQQESGLITPNRSIKINTICKKLLSNTETYDTVFKNLLPSFFSKEFIYVDKKTREKRTLSSLSSGESQLLYSLSYAIYHMKNAASNQDHINRIQYQNINLIFDEAELYYHPEYQRKFISDLLGLLNRSNLNNIKSINITIITHSPFMLSDIPNTCITALENGCIKSDLGFRTLGANIYDLLQHSFFMNSSIGAHTEKKISEFIKYYNDFINQKDKFKHDKTKEDFFEKLINSIGDNYLHKTLYNMLQQIQNISLKEREYNSYNEQIMFYEKRINELNIKLGKNKNEKN